MKNHKIFFIVLFINLLVAILFCFIVDPYGFFRTYEKNGFNQQKEGMRNIIRYSKAIEISLRKPEILLMGSSRVHDGINPSLVPFVDSNIVYNYGIDMLRINEAKSYLKHAIKNSKIKTVIFGVDFFMFNGAEKYNPSFDSTLVGREINTFDYLKSILPSKYVLTDVFNTIKISKNQQQRKEFLKNGYRPAKFVFYKVKDYKKLHYYTNWIFLSNTPNATPYYGKYIQDEQSFQCLIEFLEICKKNNINCKLFITPAHALLDGEGIQLSGLWEKLEIFKRKIVDISFEKNVEIWDFSGYNYITTEKIHTPMKYYWDSSHFSEIVGGLILKQMFGLPDSEKTYFGVKLTPNNINQHLETIRRERLQYLDNNKEDVKWIQDLYHKIQNGEKFPKENSEGIFNN
jgi:hypothetical protein